jgi:hypothetical protein
MGTYTYITYYKTKDFEKALTTAFLQGGIPRKRQEFGLFSEASIHRTPFRPYLSLSTVKPGYEIVSSTSLEMDGGLLQDRLTKRARFFTWEITKIQKNGSTVIKAKT